MAIGAKKTPKKPYEPPVLAVYGTVGQITKGLHTSGRSDSSNPRANHYTGV